MNEKWTLKIADGVSESPWYLDFESCDEDGPLRESEFTGYILDANGTEVCSRAFPIANANLIAAAPDLFTALERLYGKLLMSDRDGEVRITEEDGEMARAALAKAKGER